MTLKLPAVLKVNIVSELKEQLQELMQAEEAIELDASEVTSADAASLQLIYAFVRELDSQGREMAWTTTSQSFQDDVMVSGMHAALKLE